MLRDLLQILRVDGVEDVEEVFTVGTFVLRILVLEVNIELIIILESRPHLVYRELIKVRNINVVHLILLQQKLLVLEDLTEKVFVHL